MEKVVSWIALFLLVGQEVGERRRAWAFEENETYELGSLQKDRNANALRLWLTISAEKRYLEISWNNAPAMPGDNILLTRNSPESFERLSPKSEKLVANGFQGEGSGGEAIPSNYRSRPVSTKPLEGQDEDMGSGMPLKMTASQGQSEALLGDFWISNHGRNDIVAAIKPSAKSQWFTTGVPFDFSLSHNVTKDTKCYGYWASYINGSGQILASTCIRAYANWMHELKPIIGNMRFRDLFILGSHDSGSYRQGFDPNSHENLLTKYALTQDDNIKSQLMHGVRYLDIRIGYYKNTQQLFFINHGITRQIPLIDVINDVKDFVLETNEIVIFGLKEFPFGFKKNLSVHHLLVSFLREHFGDLIVHPSATWSATLNDIWYRRQNVILAYDLSRVVREYPDVLFTSVEQRWGNVQKWSDLENFLRNINSYDISRLSSRPVADMAEMTPDTWGVVLDKYGGLRRLADRFNWRISQLYRDYLARTANIVAVDFFRGTSLMELSIDINKRKSRQ